MGESTKNEVELSLEQTKATYVRLGKSGLHVSNPIFGCMSFGSPKWQPWVIEEDEALPLLKAAYDRGVNTWDTANVYSNGVSEEIVAKAIEKYDIPRNKVVILTKCFGHVPTDPGVRSMEYRGKIEKTKDFVNQGGLSRLAIFNAVNASLKRLNTDFIDLLQIHRFDPETPIEETMKALHDLVQMGKVNYIGASSMWAHQFALMQFCAEKNGWTKFVSMQNHYSLLYREEEKEMNAFCDLTGVGLIPWGPVARGFLARPTSGSEETARSKGYKDGSGPHASAAIGLTEVDLKIIDRVEELAKKKKTKMAHIAIAWINTKVSAPIIGFSKVERIDEATEANHVELTADEIEYLEELYQPRKYVGHS